MTRQSRRAARSPRLEALEGRSLLSGGTSAPHDLLVGFDGPAPTRAEQLALQALDACVVQSYPGGPSLVQVGPGIDPATAERRLSETWGVRYVEPERTIHIDAAIPNDPSFGDQWGLNNRNDVDIDAPEAWDITTGNPSVVVAVIDSGIDLGHPDLAGKVWVNPRVTPGMNDVNGWNFRDNTNNVQDTDGHGTHVAGTIVAARNNGIGVAGVTPDVRIMPLKFIGNDGDGSLSAAIAAIYYAVNHGAKVINASWGGPQASQALDDAIRYAGQHNVVFVTAAGNEAVNNDAMPSYPANFRESNVLSVAAVDQNGAPAGFSNWGSTTVDLAAPGVNVRSTVPGGYATYSGTSMSTPFVSGVVALLAGARPDLSAAALVQRVRATAKPLPGLADRILSGGIVDAYRALTGAPSGPGTQVQAAAQQIVAPAVSRGRVLPRPKWPRPVQRRPVLPPPPRRRPQKRDVSPPQAGPAPGTARQQRLVQRTDALSGNRTVAPARRPQPLGPLALRPAGSGRSRGGPRTA